MSASPSRRIGAADSAARARLVDAAEELLLAEGYAAVTSRRVAASASLKPQLVHYYFRTMDDLYVEVFRRRAEENLARLERTIAEGGSLRALWQFNADPRGAAFTIEFVALANHRKAIRAEIARYAERFRAAQLDAITTGLVTAGVTERETQLDAITTGLVTAGVTEREMPPIVALLLMTGLAQVLAIEGALGVTAGHDATLSFVENAITRLEPEA